MTRKSLVVLSGGQDSSTCLFLAKQSGADLYAVTFDYGQTHARELQSARDVAALAGVLEHEVVSVGPILRSSSPLVSGDNLETYGSFEEMDEIIGDRVEKTFVPMRNALFLTLAANRAISQGCDVLVTGVCQADNANYPDCRASFVASMEAMIAEATGSTGLRIDAPLMNLSKAESIALAVKTPGAYHALAYTHTAYSGEFPPITQDHATVLRAHGFREAGVPDPLVVRAWIEGLAALPETENYTLARGIKTITELVGAVGAAS